MLLFKRAKYLDFDCPQQDPMEIQLGRCSMYEALVHGLETLHSCKDVHVGGNLTIQLEHVALTATSVEGQ